MTITTTTIKNSYSGNGSNTVFAYTYKILAEGDIEVIVRSANGTETVKTLTTDYTVSGVGSASGGNVTFVTAPLSTETVVLRRETTQTQSVDLVENDPFTAETVEGAFDRAIVIAQELQEEVNRSIKLSRTNTMTSTEFTVGSTERANKILAFDGNGEIAVTQELGTYQGNWGSATDYNARDLVKDTSNNNIYLCNTSHTSSGSQPLSSNTDSAKWDLIVDAASATSSATSAASSATAAASSATAAATSASNAATSESNASTSETNASTSATSASTSATAAATSESNASTSETNAASSATAAASSATAAASSATAAASSATAAALSETNAATSESNASTSETNAASSASSASTSATNAATSATSASTSATNAATSETNAATSATSAATSATDAAASYDSFDDRYLGPKSSAPTVDNDGDALLTGALYFDTTSNAMKVYGSSGWQNAGSSINGTSDRFQYSFSSSTTTVTGTDSNGNTLVYDPPYVDVYLNGIKMVNGTDVTVTSGISVVFASPIGTSGTDYVDIVAYGTFNVATIAASAITSGTLGYARGGTGLGSLGSADEVLQVNAGGTALEYGKVDTANIADDAVGATQLNVSGNGTSGQMLTSDGDGSMTWADQPSAGLTAVTLSGTTPTIDWSAGNVFTHTLSGDTTYSFSNVSGAKEIELFLKNVGNTYDSSVIGSSPTQWNTGSSGNAAPDFMHFTDDGTQLIFQQYMYGGSTGYWYIVDASLSTAWDISTATVSSSRAVTTQYAPHPLHGEIGNNGLYWFGGSGTTVRRYDFSTAWDISTLNVVYGSPNQSVDMGSASYANWTAEFNAAGVNGVSFNSDGTKICVINSGHKLSTGSYAPKLTTAQGVKAYSLSTAWDLTSTWTLLSVGDMSTAYSLIGTGRVISAEVSKNGRVLNAVVQDVDSGSTYTLYTFTMSSFDPNSLQYFSKSSITQQGGGAFYGSGTITVGNGGRYVYMGESNGANDTYEKSIFQYNFASDYTLTFPSGVTEPLNIGQGSDPATTSYMRIVTPDGGTNYYTTEEKELV